ncbi:DoxX family protein [Prochlorococcus sp. MIT 0801]|uniref:DoxX family protein n=1 Tax=Prochlorococcus sp. MIT 0801 TaxID=1501269 RepID=UPI0004F82ABA|nr:DoxX family protein [Prochlorococcus sp. MIT 0801]AIQ96904.1 hypothetical protein EW15_0812 [Prochlorococcus sp. MIT 0801]
MLTSVLVKSIFKDFAILLLRVFTGALLIHHGFEKLNDINNFADAFVRPLHLPFPVTLSYMAAASEIVGSWALIIGLGTRLGAFAILGTMSVAIYHALVTSGFNIYLLELLALYFASATSIILLGPGKFSADYLVTEIFINKLNPVNSAPNLKTIDTVYPNKKTNISKKSKQDKNFAFPFSSFLSP